MLEGLLKEYWHQDQQLEEMHKTLTYLEYGYNTLRQKLSTVECSASELLGISREEAQALQEHIVEMETKVDNITACIEDTCSLLEMAHPCGEGDWRRIAFEDYTNPAVDCPANWDELNDPINGRFCAKGSNIDCQSTFFSTDGDYKHVCGRMIAYQQDPGEGLAGTTAYNLDSIEGYLTGLSVTHGSGTRTHVWSFVIGQTGGNATVLGPTDLIGLCPCHVDSTIIVPAFIGPDYFCDSGHNGQFGDFPSGFIFDNPLWDGEDCAPESISCCQGATPPYFVKELPTTTSDAVEVRLCIHVVSQDIAVELVELYVRED